MLAAFSLLLTAPSAAAALKITRGPYLQWVAETSIYVVWEQDHPSAASVRYGAGGALGLTRRSPSTGRRHEVRLTGLRPNRSYQYSVHAGSVQLSKVHTLQTAVRPGTPFRFAVVGDTRSNHQVHASIVAAMGREKGLRFYINTGDLVSDGEVAAQWDTFFTIERALMARVPMFAAIGNHDEHNGGADNYLRAFVLPDNSPDKEAYYSFNYGNSHFVVLDGHVNVDGWIRCVLKGKLYAECFTTRQMEWLKNDLGAAYRDGRVENIFVFIHVPPYSSKDGRTGNPQMRELMGLFKQSGVTMIITGHDHYYERGLSNNGVPYVISGGGGAGLYSLSKPSFHPHKVLRNRSFHHYVVVEVDGRYVSVSAKDQQGATYDTFSFGKRPPPRPDGGPETVPDSGSGQPEAGTDEAVPDGGGPAERDRAVEEPGASTERVDRAEDGGGPEAVSEPQAAQDGSPTRDAGSPDGSGATDASEGDGAVGGPGGCGCSDAGGIGVAGGLLTILLLVVVSRPRRRRT